jgi:nucleoside transporter
MGLFSLTLPHTPPPSKGQSVSVRQVLGLDALVMLKRPSYAVFAVASILACIPLTFYYSFTNAYLNDLHVPNAAGKMALGQVSEVGMMLLMPFILRRVTVKSILLMGMVAWTVRYVLLAYGGPDTGMWMFYVAILLHGICYDFFFMTGQLYTDQEAPSHLRSAAQGLITFLTYGAGMLIGSLISGWTVDYFSHAAGGVVTRNWQGFWISSALSAFLVLVLIAVFFRSRSRIEAK